ncbi:MAG: SH3 domain-containing protein [Eubacteriales bacterium]|nr:SH3 domain-containing protein [Eubacteriales bacterium]
MKKNLIAFGLVLIMLCSCMVVAYAMPTEHDVTYYYVDTSNHGSLNLRQAASTDADVMAQIPYGTQIMIYDYAPGDKWALCAYDQYEGYVMTRYLNGNRPSGRASSSATSSTSTSVGSESAEYKRMEAAYYYAAVRPSTPSGYVHMRWAPSKKEPVIRDFYDGQVLKVLYQDQNWCQVYDEATGVSGWMMRHFLIYAGEAQATAYTIGTIVTE